MGELNISNLGACPRANAIVRFIFKNIYLYLQA
jgi:hypothetical protein